MSLLNALLGRLIDLWLTPFRHLPPITGLTVISFMVAIGVLIVFRVTSDQQRMHDVKRQLQAAIFEMRLFNDDVRAVLRALGEALRHQGTYVRLTLVPTAVTVVLLAPVVAHLEAVYGYKGLRPGRPVLVTAHMREGFGAGRGEVDVELEVPAGIQVQTPAVWIPATHEVIWRLTPLRPGEYLLHVIVAGERFSKTMDAATAITRRSPVRPAQGVLNQLRYPVEPPLPASGPLAAIRLQYPERHLDLLGWRLHWIVVFAVLTMVAAVALRRRLRVTI